MDTPAVVAHTEKQQDDSPSISWLRVRASLWPCGGQDLSRILEHTGQGKAASASRHSAKDSLSILWHCATTEQVLFCFSVCVSLSASLEGQTEVLTAESSHRRADFSPGPLQSR